MTRQFIRLFLLTFALLVPLCLADDLTFTFALNTSPLIGDAAGPFSLDFQFTDGSGTGDANNTVNISSFDFGGGSATGSADLTGGVTGNLSSSVSMVDSSFFNEFTQEFLPGSSLSFQVASTTNVDASGVPDELSFAILDSTGVEIPTQGLASTGSDVFLDLNIDSSTSPSVHSFASDPSRSPTAGGGPITTGPPTVTETAATIPEPATVFTGATALALIAGIITRKKRNTTQE
jgi:hypothetical protein